MQDPADNICCHTYSPMMCRLQEGQTCITQHPGFVVNCTNIYVLEASVYEFVEDEGPLGDEESVHRYILYIMFNFHN